MATSVGSKNAIKDTLKREWNIPEGGEFRFEVGFDETISLRLTNGIAEVFGVELSANKEYEISGRKMAIFSYKGATLLVRGHCDVEYISTETPMSMYINTHFAIETMRREQTLPRILITGTGRTSLAKILTNYSVRTGGCPIVVDLDVSSNSLLLFPGTISAAAVDKIGNVEEAGVNIDNMSLCSYFYGHTHPLDNSKLFIKLVGQLAHSVNSRLESDSSVSAGALILLPLDLPESMIIEIQELFQAGLVIVVGNERLHSTLAKNFQSKIHPNTGVPVGVLKLPKSGGVLTVDQSYRRLSIQRQFKRYFYGSHLEYTPFISVLNFDDIQLRRIGEDSIAPASALPLGASRKVDETRITKLEPTLNILLYSILAVVHAISDETKLSEINIAGYVYVTAVDETKRQVTVLSPCPSSFPSSYFIVGNIKWIEK